MRHSVAAVLKQVSVLSFVVSVAGCGGTPAQPFGGDPLVPDGGEAGDAGGLVRGKGDASTVYVVVGADGGPGDAGAGDGSGKGSGGASGSGGSSAPASGGRSGSGGSSVAGGGAPGSGGARSTGGASGTGGAASGGRGSGGAAASGGAPGTGGMAATGGRGTGGAPATGGAAASGGAPASGGSDGGPGRGGAGTGGAAGKGGMSGTSAECQRMIEDYDRELVKARECKDLLGSCGTSVPAKLAGCGSGCTTFVEKADKLNELRKKWVQEACTAPACLLEVCSSALTSVCVANACSDLF